MVDQNIVAQIEQTKLNLMSPEILSTCKDTIAMLQAILYMRPERDVYAFFCMHAVWQSFVLLKAEYELLFQQWKKYNIQRHIQHYRARYEQNKTGVDDMYHHEIDTIGSAFATVQEEFSVIRLLIQQVYSRYGLQVVLASQQKHSESRITTGEKIALFSAEKMTSQLYQAKENRHLNDQEEKKTLEASL